MNKRELLSMAIAAVRHKTSPLFHAVYKERSAQKMLFSVTEIDWDTTNVMVTRQNVVRVIILVTCQKL